VLGKLARQHDPNVLVGFDHADDAGVYRLSDTTALVQTVDFFTPIVDDPYTFGQIAATNALSDVYAMGGRPLTALAMVCFPEKADLAILERILAGGLSKMIEANCTVIGGHSIRDDETKFGYAVTGLIDPKRVLANQGARAGDALLLTKALGTGVISTAIKKGVAKQEWIDAAVASMTTLNKAGAEAIEKLSRRAANDGRPSTDNRPVHALTDVTGFGLIGHLREMALASNVGIRVYANELPLLDGALECARAGHIPGGLKANREFAECMVGYECDLPEDRKALLFDPQTAGGLLISVEPGLGDALLHDLRALGLPAARVGEVTLPGKPMIRVT
jgi:selenide,water dikinase